MRFENNFKEHFMLLSAFKEITYVYYCASSKRSRMTEINLINEKYISSNEDIYRSSDIRLSPKLRFAAVWSNVWPFFLCKLVFCSSQKKKKKTKCFWSESKIHISCETHQKQGTDAFKDRESGIVHGFDGIYSKINKLVEMVEIARKYEIGAIAVRYWLT